MAKAKANAAKSQSCSVSVSGAARSVAMENEVAQALK